MCVVRWSWDLTEERNWERIYQFIGGARKGKGWIQGSDLVDNSVPLVLSPRAFALLRLVRRESNADAIWSILDMSAPSHDTWDDIINVIVQLKRDRDWGRSIMVIWFLKFTFVANMLVLLCVIMWCIVVPGTILRHSDTNFWNECLIAQILYPPTSFSMLDFIKEIRFEYTSKGSRISRHI